MTAFELDTAVQAFQAAPSNICPLFDVEQALDLIRRAAAVTETAPSSEERNCGRTRDARQGGRMQDVFRAIGRLVAVARHRPITGESGRSEQFARPA